MAEFFLPYDMRMSLAEAEATSQNASPSRPPFPVLEVNTQSTSKTSEAQVDFIHSHELMSQELQPAQPPELPTPGEPAAPGEGALDSMQMVERLLFFFTTLLARTDAVDQQYNLTFDRSISERIKALIHRLVNSDLHIPEFADLVQSTVCSKANPDFLPFLHQTVPLFIDAIAHARINVAWLLPYYLKPYMYGSSERTFPTPSSQNLSMSFCEMTSERVYSDSSGYPMGVQMLQPPVRTFQNCAGDAISQDNAIQSSNKLQILKKPVLRGDHVYSDNCGHPMGVQMLQPPGRTFQSCVGYAASEDNAMQSSNKPRNPKEPVWRGDHVYADYSGYPMGVQMLQPPDRNFQNRAGDATSQENTMKSLNKPQISKGSVLRGERAYSDSSGHPMDVQMLQPPDRTFQSCDGYATSQVNTMQCSNKAQNPKDPVWRGDHDYADRSGHPMGAQMLQPPDRTFQSCDGYATSQVSTMQCSNKTESTKERVVNKKKKRRFSTAEVENAEVADTRESANATIKTTFGGRAPNTGRLCKADKRGPGKACHGVVQITADDLQFLHDSRLVGTTTELKAGTGCYTAPNP